MLLPLNVNYGDDEDDNADDGYDGVVDMNDTITAATTAVEFYPFGIIMPVALERKFFVFIWEQHRI